MKKRRLLCIISSILAVFCAFCFCGCDTVSDVVEASEISDNAESVNEGVTGYDDSYTVIYPEPEKAIRIPKKTTIKMREQEALVSIPRKKCVGNNSMILDGLPEITMKSDNPDIVKVTVSENYYGYVYGVSPGTAKVTCTINDVSAVCTVTVTDEVYTDYSYPEP